MARAPSFVGLILAAGEPSRPDHALLPWHGRTLLEAHISVLMPHTDFVLVVAGSNSCLLQPIADAHAAFLTVNPHPELGQFSFLQAGLQEVLNRGRDAAIIALVDHTPAQGDTIARLRHAFEQAPRDIWAVVPEHAGRHGQPMVAGREIITAFLEADPGRSAHDIECANQEHISYLTVDDQLTVMTANASEDCTRTAP